LKVEEKLITTHDLAVGCLITIQFSTSGSKYHKYSDNANTKI